MGEAFVPTIEIERMPARSTVHHSDIAIRRHRVEGHAAGRNGH
jgi:hypothetical protein